MRTALSTIGALVLVISFIGGAQAATVTSLYGDKDGFGIGFAPNQSFSGSYPSLSKNDAADVDTITDEWISGDRTWSHTYDISSLATIRSAELDLFTNGQGWHGISLVYFNDIFVGELTDGDNSGSSLVTNWARLDTFDLLSLDVSLDGVSSITVDTFGSNGQNSGANNDRWALDYNELRVSDVPVPGTILLLGSGLVGLTGYRRKRKKQ